MIRLPENYVFNENDYWNLRRQAVRNLSIAGYEEVIRFGQRYGFADAKFNLDLDETLSCIYYAGDNENHYRYCHAVGEDMIANDEVYPVLDTLFGREDFLPFSCLASGRRYSEYYRQPKLHDSPLFFAAVQGDCRMVEYLLGHVDRHAPYHQGLYDTVLKHYLYMKLPDWGDLANAEGPQEDLLQAVEKQAKTIHAVPPSIARCLLDAGFPSAYTRLPLEYSDVHIISEAEPGYHFTVDHTDITASPRGNKALGYVHNDDDMVRALSSSGKFFPFTCECGEEGCAGLWERVQCLNTPTGMRWYKPYPLPMSWFVFKPVPVLKELEQALTGIVKRLEPEWAAKEINDDDEPDFPYGPFGTTFSSLKANLEFCRETLKKMENQTAG